MTEILKIAEPIIVRLSRKIARAFPLLEADDVAQEMRLVIGRDAESIADEPEEDWARLVNYRAARAGNVYAMRERQYYQHQTSEWVYTPAEVREILSEHMFHGDSYLDAPKRPEGSNQTLTGDGMSIPLMDARTAFDAISEKDQSMILRRYNMGESLDSAGRKAVERAVDRMTAAMNNDVSERFDHDGHDGPGSRTAMSNAQARALTSDNY